MCLTEFPVIFQRRVAVTRHWRRASGTTNLTWTYLQVTTPSGDSSPISLMWSPYTAVKLVWNTAQPTSTTSTMAKEERLKNLQTLMWNEVLPWRLTTVFQSMASSASLRTPSITALQESLRLSAPCFSLSNLTFQYRVMLWWRPFCPSYRSWQSP